MEFQKNGKTIDKGKTVNRLKTIQKLMSFAIELLDKKKVDLVGMTSPKKLKLDQVFGKMLFR